MYRVSKVLSIVLAGIAIGCLIGVGMLYLEGEKDDKEAEELIEALQPTPIEESTPSKEQEPSSPPVEEAPTQTIPSSSKEESSEPKETTSAAEEVVEDTPTPVANPYADSYKANKDMAAWLQIPGTVIDYPVMWTPGDENYYLYRGFDKKENKNGCLILDTDSCVDPLSTNLIIHGHNMKSGAMFGDLTDYEKKEYFDTHKEIILYTPECERRYEVIAVFRSQVYRKNDKVFKFYNFFQADTEKEFLNFYNNIKALSLYDTGVSAQFGDHFITLSTCVYHVENGRFVVVAKEIEGGDTYLPLE